MLTLSHDQKLAAAARVCGGQLLTFKFALPAIPPADNGGCGASTHVAGTNGGTMPCGALLHRFGKAEPYYCGACSKTCETHDGEKD